MIHVIDGIMVDVLFEHLASYSYPTESVCKAPSTARQVAGSQVLRRSVDRGNPVRQAPLHLPERVI